MSYHEKIDLLKAFSEGMLKIIDLSMGNVFPPSGKKWLILHGNVYHQTGTNSFFIVNVKGETPLRAVVYHKIAGSAIATSVVPIFSTLSDNGAYQQPLFLVITPNLQVTLSGGAGIQGYMFILEW